MAALDVWVKNIGTHRGAPRVYLDGAQAARAGFAPGDAFEVVVDGSRVKISKHPDGTRTVVARRRGDAQLPVIDINSRELLGAFKGMKSVRVVVGEDAVYLLPLASEVKKRERLTRLARKVAGGEPLNIGSLSHGGGILSHAVHQGLLDAGLRANMTFANELRDDLVMQAMRVNDAWIRESAPGSPRTAAVVLPMQELAQDDWALQKLGLLEVLEMGLPCSGASKAGKSKRGLEHAEDHPEVGHLVYAALVIISRTQPAIVWLENVPTYAETASAQILRYQLRDMGFVIHEAILEGKDFGVLEDRRRWCMVAVTQGVHFDFDQVRPPVRVVRMVQEVLEEVPLDDPRWRTFQHLKDKRERDEAKGSNFKMQIVAPTDTQVPTLRKGYHKGGSTDPLLRHPTDPSLLRQFTAAEHARIKGVPAHLIDGLSQIRAHQLLGQGIVYEPFRAVAERIGVRIREAIAAMQEAGEVEIEPGELEIRRERMTG